MFLGNSVAAAAYACVAAVGGLPQKAAAQPGHAGADHLERADQADPLCLQQCAQKAREPTQPVAVADTLTPAAIPTGGACTPARLESAVSRVALAPQAAGPPLTILFCSFLT